MACILAGVFLVFDTVLTVELRRFADPLQHLRAPKGRVRHVRTVRERADFLTVLLGSSLRLLQGFAGICRGTP